MKRYRMYHAYCSARDQKVRVVRRSEVMGEALEDRDVYAGSDVICLEYGDTCTGAICPLFDVPTGEMRHRLAEVGLV
jgi:hypothetical protein